MWNSQAGCGKPDAPSLDLRRIGVERSIEVDLCIVGGGAAGLVLAQEFRGSRVRVCVLESGGLEPPPDPGRLYEVEADPRLQDALRTGPPRWLGGATQLWNGWCIPFDAIDFEARSWVPRSGWPFGRRELEPYYRRAEPLLELDVALPWRPDASPRPLPAVDSARIEYRVWKLSPPSRLGSRWRSDLERSPNIQLLLGASAVGLETDRDASRVEGVRVANPQGFRGRVRARLVVLACGAIEVPRLLLASNQVMPRGLGNSHDQVGRFFMEHPHLDIAELHRGHALAASALAAC
jgi:choline dehydrogenase-like flavoprotein